MTMSVIPASRIGMVLPYRISDWYGGCLTCHTASGATEITLFIFNESLFNLNHRDNLSIQYSHFYKFHLCYCLGQTKSSANKIICSILEIFTIINKNDKKK